MINSKHGKKVPFNDYSLGYKTVASWVVDLSWRLINQYPKSPNPLLEPAIVIIDEIDLHLHPVWQREIINNLSNHFKNVQFIATAHSPLMVQSALGSNYAVLKNGEYGVEVIREPTDVDGWQVDQILTSSFFGLKSSRGTKYEALLSEREKLAGKKTLTQKEKLKLIEITRELEDLNKYPSGETLEEIEDRKVISNLVSEIRRNKIKIKI